MSNGIVVQTDGLGACSAFLIALAVGLWHHRNWEAELSRTRNAQTVEHAR